MWPGTHNGVEAYTANDNQTAYFAVSNMGFALNQDRDDSGITSGYERITDTIRPEAYLKLTLLYPTRALALVRRLKHDLLMETP